MKRNEIFRYEGEVKYDPQFETGYPNVSMNTGNKGKYKSILYLKKRRKVFVGNNAKKVEKDRKKWINQNARIWTDSIKYEESIFFTKRTKKLYESEDLIKNIEVENWRNILNNNTHKLWLLIKRKIKEKTKLFQVHKWRLSKEGKVMRKYKNDWWVDNIIQDVNSPLVHEIRRMRIGCSKKKLYE